MEMTVEYAKERMAFGRPIGAYQAIKHSLADMLGQVECCNVSALHAAWALSEDAPESSKAAAIAKAYTSDAYCAITQRSIPDFRRYRVHLGNDESSIFQARARQCRIVRQFADPARAPYGYGDEEATACSTGL